MRALGMIPMPTSQWSEAQSSILKRCNQYAADKAIDDFKTSGKVSTLDTLQADVDACVDSLDRSRQWKQGLLIAAGVAGAGYLGFLLLKR